MQCIIVDDEPQARKLLQTYLSTIAGVTVTRLCASAMEAYEALQTGQVDLMFLDIKMPVISGMEFLYSLKTPPLVIFTTAYPQYAVEGFELDALDYLLKPVSMPRLVKAVEKARLRMQQIVVPNNTVAEYIFIKQEGKLVKVLLSQVAYIEGMQNYVKIFLTDNKTIVAAYTMHAMEDLLPAGRFIRVHRSFIVALAAIDAVTGNTIEIQLRNIPIGLSYKENVFKMLGKG